VFNASDVYVSVSAIFAKRYLCDYEEQCGPGWLSPYSDTLRARRSENQIPAGARFFRNRADGIWGLLNLL
jgi:hypothetical protein